MLPLPPPPRGYTCADNYSPTTLTTAITSTMTRINGTICSAGLCWTATTTHPPGAQCISGATTSHHQPILTDAAAPHLGVISDCCLAAPMSCRMRSVICCGDSPALSSSVAEGMLSRFFSNWSRVSSEQKGSTWGDQASSRQGAGGCGAGQVPWLHHVHQPIQTKHQPKQQHCGQSTTRFLWKGHPRFHAPPAHPLPSRHATHLH